MSSTYKATKGICIRVTDSRLAKPGTTNFFDLEACGTLVPQPVFKSVSPAVEDWSLSWGPGPRGKSPIDF